MRVPFKSLRYTPGASQIWGIQFRRVVRRRTERAFLTPLPVTAGAAGIARISRAATLVGLEAPPGSKNLELKPYGISRVTRDRTVTPSATDRVEGDVGLDVKYGLTQNLTADFTYNTDFAQVEADNQQVNLTRFNLFFPEKREFFLESSGTFAFGGGAALRLFFSRRIGLNGGRVVPIRGGVRLTGKIGGTSIGALNLQTDRELASGTPATNFAVVRVTQDILRRSSVGGLCTSRSQSVVTRGASNSACGVDAQFSFYENIDLAGYYARTGTRGLTGRPESYQVSFGYVPDAYGFTVDHLFVGDDFNPEVGFVPRPDMRRTFVSGRVSPRFSGRPRLRRLLFTGSLEYITDGLGVLETRNQVAGFEAEFHSSDRLRITGTRSYDRLARPFPIAPGVTIPSGGYDSTQLRATYSLGRQKRWTGSVSAEHGSFFDGHQTALGFTSGRLAFTPHLAVEPAITISWIDLPFGSFTAQLYRTRLTYTFTPRMFVSSLVQHNSSNDSLSTNLRLRWEYRPGSELFVVYNEERDTLAPSYPDLENRAFIVKINNLFRF